MSQSPRFGSRCCDPVEVVIASIREPADLSQSPRFGSRCFDPPRPEGWEGRADWAVLSQSPRFGSRCFDARGIWPRGCSLPVRPRRNPLGSGLGVSTTASGTGQPATIPSARRNPLGSGLGVSTSLVLLCPLCVQILQSQSQSPRFGSRCFDGRRREVLRMVEERLMGRNPLGSGLGVSTGCVMELRVVVYDMRGSQSPRFGSRCFDEVLPLRKVHVIGNVAIPSVRVSVFRRPSTIFGHTTYSPCQVAIPSVRVSVFRRPIIRLWEDKRALARRNPLGSGLGVSTWVPYWRSPGPGFCSLVAIPSVRVSVFRPARTSTRSVSSR